MIRFILVNVLSNNSVAPSVYLRKGRVRDTVATKIRNDENKILNKKVNRDDIESVDLFVLMDHIFSMV